MTPKWDNIIFFIVVMVGVYFLVKFWPLLKNIGEEIDMLNNCDDPLVGMIALGLICLTIVGTVKIICSRRGQQGDRQ
jgi:hypothetical protein